MTYNIAQQLNIFISVLAIFLIPAQPCEAQHFEVSKYGVSFINDLDSYKKTVREDSSKRMTDIQSMIPGIVLDLRYATTNNFMKQRMYPRDTHRSFLRLPAARALAQVQQELNKKGYGLKIFDAYRPYSVTERFWELVHDDRYVADPSKGSGHNRGIAVDLTIIDLHTKQELKMPTGFDNFTDSAHQDFMQLPGDVLQNRKLLRDVMEKYGFVALKTEWWHFSLPDSGKYEVLNIGFQDLPDTN